MAIRSDYGIILDCPIFKREAEIICMFLFVISCSVLWLMMAIWFEPWWITKAHSLFYQEDGTHYMLCLAGGVRTVRYTRPICLCPHLLLLNLYVWAQGWACILPEKVSNGPHLWEICREHCCHLEKWKTESEGRDETDNRGVSLCPQTLLFQAFLITLQKKGTMCSIDTHLEHSVRAAQSALSANRRKKNQRAERQGEGGTRWKIRTPQEIKPRPQRLYSSFLL